MRVIFLVVNFVYGEKCYGGPLCQQFFQATSLCPAHILGCVKGSKTEKVRLLSTSRGDCLPTEPDLVKTCSVTDEKACLALPDCKWIADNHHCLPTDPDLVKTCSVADEKTCLALPHCKWIPHNPRPSFPKRPMQFLINQLHRYLQGCGTDLDKKETRVKLGHIFHAVLACHAAKEKPEDCPAICNEVLGTVTEFQNGLSRTCRTMLDSMPLTHSILNELKTNCWSIDTWVTDMMNGSPCNDPIFIKELLFIIQTAETFVDADIVECIEKSSIKDPCPKACVKMMNVVIDVAHEAMSTRRTSPKCYELINRFQRDLQHHADECVSCANAATP